jgi:putative flavoprotein involved in K+ transport
VSSFLLAEAPAWVTQLFATEYRNPRALPPGAIVVVGSGQSGGQIAEELYQSGRTVYLSVGSSGRPQRRYRGADSVHWLDRSGFFERTPELKHHPSIEMASTLRC